MKVYPIPLVPGPVRVPEEVLAVYQNNFGSGDLEQDFLELYNQTESKFQKIMVTRNKVVIQSGEGMIALWGALKSCLLPGDKVLSIASGVFGYGFAEMAQSLGAVVKIVGLAYDETISNWQEIETAIAEFKPKMITVIHCETPSGTLNPLAELGKLKTKYKVPLLCVDTVASLGGAPVLTDEWAIDLNLGGSQKCISAPPSMAFVSVSETAWEIIDQVNYPGYDALKPFQKAQENFYFPYTPYWHGMAALSAALDLLLQEGLENGIARHQKVADFCREEIQKMGLELYPTAQAISSPTVTAVKVPSQIGWQELDRRFRQHGLAVAGSYGPLAGKVFRIGHMGTQADLDLVRQGLDVIRQAI